MSTVTGSLVFDVTRMNTATDPGIANVPVVLQNISTGMTLAVLTDSAGNYTFNNVPAGDYQVVEYYGYEPAVSSPGDFSAATVKQVITTGGIVPPAGYVVGATAEITNIDSVTATSMKITVPSAGTVQAPIIRNGPVFAPPRCCVVKFCQQGCGSMRLTVKYGTPIAMPPDPLPRSGFTFAGWYTGCNSGNMWNFSDPVTGNMTLYAMWAPSQ